MYQLDVFEYRNEQQVRTVDIDGEIWFYAIDVCDILEIKNPSNVYSRIDEDDLRSMEGIDKIGRKTGIKLVNESGLYNLIFESRKPEARKFKRWVTSEVLPQIRKTGAYAVRGSAIPKFIKRFNENWDRVDHGYFSVINELAIRVYGRLEQIGYVLPDRSAKGKEIRPDVSVGKLFPKWLEEKAPEKASEFKHYRHKFADGLEVDARQYKNELLHLFIEYVDTEWMRDRAYKYFKERDEKALEYLPKLIPDLKTKRGKSYHQITKK